MDEEVQDTVADVSEDITDISGYLKALMKIWVD